MASTVANNEEYFVDKQMFVIAVNNDNIPLLRIDGKLVLIYTDKEKADVYAEKCKQKYKDSVFWVTPIQDNKAFFARMVAYGIYKFLLNGDGKIYDFADYCDMNLLKSIEVEREILAKIHIAQPKVRPVDDVAAVSASGGLIDSLKKLPKIHKKRLITSYICCILCVGSLIGMGVSGNRSYWFGLFVCIAFVASLVGISYSSRVWSKFQIRNPKISKLANPPLYICAISIIVFFGMVVFSGSGDSGKSNSRKKAKSTDYSYSGPSGYEYNKTMEKINAYYDDKLDIKSNYEAVTGTNDDVLRKKLKELEMLSRGYSTAVGYEKGTVTNNVYRSEFINLYGRLPDGYTWMNDEQLKETLSSDKYQIDYEVGVVGTSSDANDLMLFTIKIGYEAKSQDWLEILNELNKGFTFVSESTRGTTIFTNMGLDDPKLQIRRRYLSASFKKDDVVRDFKYAKVNDRLVCIMEQRNADAASEVFSVFCEY